MEAPATHADPMLERAVRLGGRIARLPALPTHDWLDRAAGAIAEAVPGATVLALLSLPQDGGIERVGATGPDSESLERDPRSLMRQVERLPPSPGDGVVVEPLATYFRKRLGRRFAKAEVCLMGSAPLAAGESRRLHLVVAGAPLGEIEAALWLAMPDLVERALAALGPEPGEPTHWLLPGDLQLIQGLVAGKTIAEIARDSNRTEYAVQDSVKAMYRRLGRNRRTDLVARAVGHVPASEIEGKAGE